LIRQSDLDLGKYGAALLRVAMGLLFLGHVGVRITLITMPVAVDYFRSIGLPGPLVYLVTTTEAVAGALLVLGSNVRKASLAALVVLISATVIVHWRNGFLFTNPGGGWEFPAFWSVALIAQCLLGPGTLSLDKGWPWRR